MLKFFKRLLAKFLAKFRSDRADSILVPAMILIPVVALCIGMAIEVSKNNYIRTERISAIQDAANSAVSLADSRGSMNWKVVDRVVNEYEHNRFGGKTFSRTNNTQLKYDESVRETAESQALVSAASAKDDACLVDGETGAKYPQYKVTLQAKRGATSTTAPSVTFNRTQPTMSQLNSQAPLGNTLYRVVEVQIIDQAPNIVLGMAGMPCQKFTLSASAVTFGADSDLG